MFEFLHCGFFPARLFFHLHYLKLILFLLFHFASFRNFIFTNFYFPSQDFIFIF
ncbi:unnamed protein product [Meloidogyne enterolobii]|uniref:Uncharacterized protein n=1 Tax=Meloidogyne enterolobii TaxID=390850 RepID=A0ACB0ZA41_MELEN